MSTPSRGVYRFGPFSLDADAHVLLREGAVIPLSPKVVQTLAALVTQSGAVVTKEDLMRAVWPDTVVEESNLTQNVCLLRKTLGQEYIETIPKRGYRFTVPAAGEARLRTRGGRRRSGPADDR